MKITEIVFEGRQGKKPKQATQDTGEWVFRDKGGVDRTYNLNRVMMAAACADGKTDEAVDMDQSSWVEKNNIARPYTEVEHGMMRQAFKTVDSTYKESEKDHKSREPEDTQKQSPTRQVGPIQRKKK